MHHQQYDAPPVYCIATKNRDGAPCSVHNQRSFSDAAPLRRGSLYCHHHRKKCEGWVKAGEKCCLSSSSEHAHADPLRRGERFCTHHAAQEDRQRCDACWRFVSPEEGMQDDHALIPGPVKPWYCSACWAEWKQCCEGCGAMPCQCCEGCGAMPCRCMEYHCEGCGEREAYCSCIEVF